MRPSEERMDSARQDASGLSAKQPGALAAIGAPSLRSASSTYPAGTPSSAGLARNTAASPYHTAITQTDAKVVCLRNSQVCSGGRRRPVAAFRFLDVPLRVRLRQRALRGTPLPRHTTPPLHRQTRKWSVCAIARCALAAIGVPSLRSASSTYRCGYAFVSGPCEEHRCRRHTTPPLHRQTTRGLAGNTGAIGPSLGISQTLQ